MSRQTIGENPLDALDVLLSSHDHTNGVEKPAAQQLASEHNRQKKNRLTVQISEEVIEKLKDAVYWTPGATLADFAEQALLNHVNALEKERGQAFPKRSGQLKTGRPMK